MKQRADSFQCLIHSHFHPRCSNLALARTTSVSPLSHFRPLLADTQIQPDSRNCQVAVALMEPSWPKMARIYRAWVFYQLLYAIGFIRKRHLRRNRIGLGLIPIFISLTIPGFIRTVRGTGGLILTLGHFWIPGTERRL